ncbi:TetR/AcrR family transcriptional regulator [Endozoicomonas numazuensis]|uniref:TetR family transcriptional regulator n=1 Tax=Endozoicomonas numazuensis TaxID=1137799 RepID=A0A081NEA4_9GAMM|nr:TetR/AcrR family transcriptional regulator [Endozoicomonas numazuensis]KEQ16777.1 TetR family transcriptional regulator [Endozoicomonas numazuensis]
MAVVKRMPQKTGRIRTERVRLILKAAEQEFALNGYKGATVQRIADLANLPKPNVLYYFSNKQEIYDEVLNNILNLWNDKLNEFHPEDDPAESLERYIRSKVEVSRKYPTASRIFASEIIHGGQQLSSSMKTSTQEWVKNKVDIFQHWMDEGKMAHIEPMHLIFLIWGSTQHYADYEKQICWVMKKKKLPASEYEKAADTICNIVLRGCGLKA